MTLSKLNDAGDFSGDTSRSGSEGSSISGTLSFTDSIDGASSPGYTVRADAANGTASINATTGGWSYVPTTDFNGTDSFIVQVTDDDGHTETQSISLNISPINDAGSFSGATSVSGTEDDSSITGTLSFSDSKDGDSAPNYSVSSDAANGGASIDAATGVWSYVPNTDFNGSDSFTVQVTDDTVIPKRNHQPDAQQAQRHWQLFRSNIWIQCGRARLLQPGLTDRRITSAPNCSVSDAASNGIASISNTTGAWSYVPIPISMA